MPTDGIPRRCAAYYGESLLDVIKRHRVPGMIADCDGGDKELKPSQVPYDYYSMGALCA